MLQGLDDELVQVFFSPAPEGKTAEQTIIKPENLLASILASDRWSRNSDLAQVDEDVLPVHTCDIIIVAVPNTRDSFFDIDGIGDVFVGDVGLDLGLALSTSFLLSIFTLTSEFTGSLHVHEHRVGCR